MAARSLDKTIMAILAVVYSSIEIRTLDDWYSQPAAIVIRHGANRRDEGKSRPRPRIGRPSWQPMSRFWQRLFFWWERLHWNSSLGSEVVARRHVGLRDAEPSRTLERVNASSKGQPNYHNITRIAFAGVRGMRTSVGVFQTSASDDTERQDGVTVAEQPPRRGQRQVDGGGARIRSDG